MTWRLVVFPLILPWRQEFWSLPLYFPELTAGVLWQWPPGVPYQGRPLPPAAEAGGRELRHYAPGELKQWQAYKEYASDKEGLEDIVRALKGEPEAPGMPEGPWKDEDAFSLAWQLEIMEADQEAHLSRVDLGEERLAETLTPETWEERGDFARGLGDMEIVDPETARLRYLLWRREMGAPLGAESLPLLLGRTSKAIFASLRKEGGGGMSTQVRLSLPGCRTAEEYLAARGGEAVPGWLPEFKKLLGACLSAADQDADLESPTQDLTRWVTEELAQQWPNTPAWSWDLEIWGKAALVKEGGEALLAWGGRGEEVVPG